MKNKLILMGLIIMSGSLFLLMAYFGQWFGMLCMGGAFVCSLMALKYECE
jgi:hypothetical protein